MREKPIAVTTGEPAGIGPEVALKAAVAADYPIVLLGDRALLDATRKKLGLPTLPANVAVEDVPLSVPAVPGQLDVRNSAYVVKLLERGCDGALAGDFAAVATAPVQKSILCGSSLYGAHGILCRSQPGKARRHDARFKRSRRCAQGAARHDAPSHQGAFRRHYGRAP